MIKRTNSILNDQFNTEVKEENRDELIKILRTKNVDSDIITMIDNETKYNHELIKKLQKNQVTLESRIEILNRNNKILNKKNKDMESLLIQVYQNIYLKHSKETFNIMNEAMKELFSEPTIFLDYEGEMKENSKRNKVISSHFLNKLEKD